MLVAFSISPTSTDGTGSVTDGPWPRPSASCGSPGCPTGADAMFTNLEGEWDEVMAVVKQAVDVVAAELARGWAWC